MVAIPKLLFRGSLLSKSYLIQATAQAHYQNPGQNPRGHTLTGTMINSIVLLRFVLAG